MAHLYYLADRAAATAEEPVLAVGSVLRLTGDEGRHAARVARVRAGETTLIGDGRGRIAECVVEAVTGSECVARVTRVTEVPPAAGAVTLVQALAKGDRDERAVEQATEFGVDRVVPWQAARSVSRWQGADKRDRGRARWQRVAREAAKQSLRAWIPRVADCASSADLAAAAAAFAVEPAPATPAAGIDRALAGAVLILHPQAPDTLSAAVRELPRDAAVTLLVGPEGGIAPEELAQLTAAGARPVRLGREVLRTSSAGCAALAVIHTVRGAW